MGTIDAIIQPLGARHWAVVFSPPSTGDFILSDNPVNLHWREKKEYRIWRSPGYGPKETEVTIPLSSRIMLMGHFEDIPSNLNIYSKKDLASMNNFTVMHSDRFLLTKKDFLWLKQDGSVGRADDLRQLITRSRR